MFQSFNSDRWLGLCAVVVALIVACVWVPMDISTGVVEKVRRATVLGDSMGPVIAACVIFLGGVMLLASPAQDTPALSRQNVVWIGLLLGALTVSLLLMRWLGPALAMLLADQPYRNLRSTLPWTYLGYVAGGGFMVFALTSLAANRPAWRFALIGLVTALAFALLYDLPFDDLLLPPNGDV